MLRRFFTVLVAGWAVWRFFGPRVPPSVNGIQDAPLRVPGRTVFVGRTEMFVREMGPPDAPPLVLLHGWVYDGMATYSRMMPILAERYRLYVVDLRSHGKTDRRQGRLEIADMADDVDACLEALGLRSVPVVGYSMGGMTAQELIKRHPSRVSRLVLFATAAHPVAWPRWAALTVFMVGRALARLDPVAVPRISHRYLLKVGAVAPEHAAWLWDELLDRDTDLYYQAGFAILRFDATKWVGKIDVPTLSIIPTEDQMIPADRQRATAALLQDNRVIELEGARHEAGLTRAGEVARAIIDFVAE